jgi:transposase-like protein
VIDLDQAWKEAAKEVFPNVSIQFCAVHFERAVDT